MHEINGQRCSRNWTARAWIKNWKRGVEKMANEVEKTAINEVLRTVTLINKRFEEIIELQRQQDLAIFYLRGVLDAKDQVL